MATDTTIEWADKTWSPIIGCDRVSPACDQCYAMGIARIREFNPNPKIRAAFAGTTINDGNGVDWSGQVNLLDDRLTQPMAWKKPRKVFVNSMSDLFHDDVSDGLHRQGLRGHGAQPAATRSRSSRSGTPGCGRCSRRHRSIVSSSTLRLTTAAMIRMPPRTT
jgi:protein gp37